MLKKFLIILSICLTANLTYASENQGNPEDARQKAYALYATKNYKEAEAVLENLSAKEKTKETFLLLSNIADENKDTNLAVKNLNKALSIDPTYYKAYYNLGCIFAKKKSYLLAMNNFELAIKHNKDFANAYYNLASCQIQQKNYEAAKKNLIKALELDKTNKDIYYNLAYCYKELNKPKQAQKLLDAYNSFSSADKNTQN